jgi:hypothetical protein
VDQLIQKDLMTLAQNTVKTCNQQWAQRKTYESITASLPIDTNKNGMRGLPNNWCELINTMVRPCIKCKEHGVVTSRWHLLTKHKILLPHVNHIWHNELLPITQATTTITINGPSGTFEIEKPVDRQEIRDKVKPIIQKHLEEFNNAFGSLIVQAHQNKLPSHYHPLYSP